MKKYLFLILILVLLPMTLMAQDGTVAPIGFEDYFTSLGTLVGGVLALFSLLNTRILKKPMNDTWTQVSAWGFSILLGLFGYWREIGIFYEVGIWWTLIYSFAAGLVSSGAFKLEAVKGLLEFLKLLVPMANKRT